MRAILAAAVAGAAAGLAFYAGLGVLMRHVDDARIGAQ